MSFLTRLLKSTNIKQITSAPFRTFCDSPLPYSEKSFNQVTLLGRVGMEPQLRGTEANPVLVFTMATNTNIKQEDGFKQKTEWHRVSVFKPYLRETATSYLRKGSRVFVQGKLMYGEVVDQKGITHQTTTIAVDEMIFIGIPQSNLASSE